MPAITFLHNFAARMLPPFVPHPTSGVISFPVAKFHANTPRDFNDRATENLNIFHPSISLVFPPDLKPRYFVTRSKSFPSLQDQVESIGWIIVRDRNHRIGASKFCFVVRIASLRRRVRRY